MSYDRTWYIYDVPGTIVPRYLICKLFGIFEFVEKGTVKLIYTGTEDMIADALTKALAGNKHRKFAIVLLGNQTVFLTPQTSILPS